MRELFEGDGPQRRRLQNLRELLSRPGIVRHSEEGRSELFERVGIGYRDGGAERGGTEASAGPHRAAEHEERIQELVFQTGGGKRIREESGKPGVQGGGGE